MAQHKAQSEQLAKPDQECNFIFIGDSISDYWKRHPAAFSNFNQNNSARTYANPGDRIHEIGWRLSEQGGGFANLHKCIANGKGTKAKSIFLLIGTNDLGAGSTLDVALRDYDALLHQMVDFMATIEEERRVTLYVTAIFPRADQMEMRKMGNQTFGEWNGHNPWFESINLMNQYLKRFVDGQSSDDIQFMDCNRYFLERTQNEILFDLGTGLIKVDIMHDMLHPTEIGYEKWTQCIFDTLKKP